MNLRKTLRAVAVGLLALLAMPQLNAAKHTFTATCLNVDGLPQTVMGINVNPEGPGSAGSKKISQGIKNAGWDIIAFSEDFNYHDDVVSEIKNDYEIGTKRAEISISALTGTADTDGLCFLVKKPYSFSGESMTEWNTHIGDLNHGADSKIKKGFRYYCVDFGNGLQVDVYIHHMNSEDSDVAINAKHDEITQLVNVIKATNNRRPSSSWAIPTVATPVRNSRS